MSKKKVGVTPKDSKQPSAVGPAPSMPVVKIDSQNIPKSRLTKLERIARKEANQSVRVAAYGGNFGNSGGGSTTNADAAFYSPQLSTDFLELPQSEREKRELFRFWYNSQPIVGAAIDFHTDVPMSKIRLSLPKGKDVKQCKQILHFYKAMCTRVHLFQSLYDATHEYWLNGNCLERSNTLITTNRGSIPMDDVGVGDLVLTHLGRYKPVTAVSQRISDHINDIEISMVPFSLRATDEHPIEVLIDGASQWKFASSIQPGDFIRTSYFSEISDVDSVNILGDFDKATKFGYDHVIKSKHHRQIDAQKCRVAFLQWLQNLDDPIIASRSSLAEKFGVKIHTFHNVISQLAIELKESFHRRVGHGKFGGGSAVEWLPIKIDQSMMDPSYDNQQIYHFDTPIELPVESDLMYLIGYWLGDGTQTHVTKKGSRHRHFWRLVFGRGSEKQADKCREILSRLVGLKYVHEVIDSRGLLTMYIGSHPAWINWWKNNFGETSHGSIKKCVPTWVMRLPKEKQMHMVAGLMDSDGCLSQNGKVLAKISMTSKLVMDSLREIFLRCGIVPAYTYRKAGYARTFGYQHLSRSMHSISIFRNSWCREIESFCVKKFPTASIKSEHLGTCYQIIDGSVWLKVNKVTREVGNFDVGNFEVADDHTFQASYVSTHNCFIFCEDHDLTSELTDDLVTNESQKEIESVDWAGRPNSKVEKTKTLKPQSERVAAIHKMVAEKYQGWQRLQILPPEQVKIEVFQYTNKVRMELIPSEKDRLVVLKSQEQNDVEAQKIADDIPEQIRENLLSGQPIPLNTSPYDDFLCSSFCHHLAHKKSAYDDRGISLLERCLRTLLYSDKIRQAQTSIASRSMTPKRVIWADKMSELDVDALRDQVDQALIDPDYSIVTNFEVHWDEIGARDRLLDLSSEYDMINKMLFIGLRITESMLTGESSYSGERIHLDVMNTMYLLYRETIAQFVEERLFAPVAEKKGFFEIDEFGNKQFLYPKLQFTRLALRDNTELQDFMFNLYQKGSLPISFILDLINIDSDDAREQLERDMFTPNDSTFNELLRTVYTKVAEKLIDDDLTDAPAKLAKALKLDYKKKEAERFGKE